MKKLILFLFLAVSITALAQEATDSLSFIKPREGKSMVYIVRPGSEAFLIKFSIYDGDTFLGKLGHGKYFAYECNPGNHVFIAKAENTSYLEANIEAGRIYVIGTILQMGILTARVSLEPMDKTHKKFAKQKENLLKFVGQKKKGELLVAGEEEEDKTDATDTPSKRMEKFGEMKQKGKKIKTLEADMYID